MCDILIHTRARKKPSTYSGYTNVKGGVSPCCGISDKYLERSMSMLTIYANPNVRWEKNALYKWLQCSYKIQVEHLGKSPLKLLKQLWADLITTVSLHCPQDAFPLILFQQRLAGLVELLQTLLPRLFVVIRPLGE